MYRKTYALRKTEDTLRGRDLRGAQRIIAAVVAIAWSAFQLWYASPLPFIFKFGVFIDVPARGIHLSFALLLCFLLFPLWKKGRDQAVPFWDFILALIGGGSAFYLNLAYEGLVARNGILLEKSISVVGFSLSIPLELILASFGIVVLLEATRRAIGLPLVIVAILFLGYSYFGQLMPYVIAHQGLSFNRLVGYQWLSGEAVFGIPISVSVSFVFLFVLFGALLEHAGGGRYFLNLAIAIVGRFRGGPAKAAILASGLTGMMSGSSIANVVTTGTFTIPTMKRTGFSSIKAGAIEVAASVNGQIMPPIMGAAAFIMAEIIGITYFEVITHALIPALITYLALFFIAHIEAHKHGLKGIDQGEIPELWPTFVSGIHFLIPIAILVYLLIIERWTAGSAVFYSVLSLAIVIIFQNTIKEKSLNPKTVLFGFLQGLKAVSMGLVRGAVNMVPVTIAIACAGIIVGAVASSGLSNAMVEVVEIVSGGNFYVLLIMIMILCLVLGLGLPTTANYLVVAALLANVIVEIGSASGYVLPLIAVHLFVFYFGLMADVTPPVGLAAYAASGISGADPIKTGIQAFWYEIRTAILPFIFIFNPELLLVGVTSFWRGLLIFVVSLVAMLCFTSATQGWLVRRLRWSETIGLLIAAFVLFRPDIVVNLVSPKFTTVQENFMPSSSVGEKRKLRVKLIRSTDYGDRYRLIEFDVASRRQIYIDEFLGWSLKKSGEHHIVDELSFAGLARQKGVENEDQIIKIEISNARTLSKDWGYILGIFILIIVTLSQKRWNFEFKGKQNS